MALLDKTNGPKIHKKDNGNTLVVEEGGKLLLQQGALVGRSGSEVALPIASANQAVATDAASVIVLANALRSALLAVGVIKGSA